jgi:lipopolysaccharide biosynthesis glycosyltransferase
MDLIRLAVGFDQREAVAYHVFCQSVISKSSLPIVFLPLALNNLPMYSESHSDGSNNFIYSRFLTPYLYNFSGWAIFTDGDMVCNDDIAKLWALKDDSKAVIVVPHDYQTKASQKYLGNKNENYPRKNWSSVILWNCGHPKNKVLTPSFVGSQSGAFLHRFQWLDDSDIGFLPLEWNWLAIEYEDNYDAKLIHYTLGTPCFKEYRNTAMADLWEESYESTLTGLNA